MGKATTATPAKKGNGHGGPRANSGRPSNKLTKARDDLDGLIIDLIGPKVPKVIAAILDLALGVKEKVEQPDGKKREVYTTPPDFRAAAYLLDRVAGKPRQALEVSGTGVIDQRTAVQTTDQKSAEYQDPDDEPGDGDAPA